jgi:hypothetical protein
MRTALPMSVCIKKTRDSITAPCSKLLELVSAEDNIFLLQNRDRNWNSGQPFDGYELFIGTYIVSMEFKHVGTYCKWIKNKYIRI